MYTTWQKCNISTLVPSHNSWTRRKGDTRINNVHNCVTKHLHILGHKPLVKKNRLLFKISCSKPGHIGTLGVSTVSLSTILIFETGTISTLWFLFLFFILLRKSKYRPRRPNLEILYLMYITRLFEYSCELWDNYNIEKQIRTTPNRIVTGLPFLYFFIQNLKCCIE